MEFQFPVLLAILLLFLLSTIMKLGNNAKTKLPPGPWKLPMIGSLHHLRNGLPHHTLRNLAEKHGPLMHLQLGEVFTVIISSPEIAKAVLTKHDLMFADRPVTLVSERILYGSTDIIFSPVGSYWRELRKICMLELLSAKRVQSFRSMREEEVSNLIGNITSLVSEARIADGFISVNISKKIFSLTNDIVARAAFGEKFKDKHVLLPLLQEALVLGSGFDVSDFFPSKKFLHVMSGTKLRIEELHRKLDGLISGIIRDHKENKTETRRKSDEDLVDVLLRVQEDGKLDFPITTDNIKAIILDMFFAGSDTSSSILEWIMSELVRNPREMEKVQTEVRHVFNGKLHAEEAEIHKLSYLKLVIKETLRLHPAGPLLVPRECREKCMLNGYEIPKNSQLLVNIWAISRDHKYWADADRFKPERFDGVEVNYKGGDFRFIPFGAGRRICPGIDFAMANIELPLAQLLYHFDWKIANNINPKELDMTETFGGTVRRTNELYLIPSLYNNLPSEKDI